MTSERFVFTNERGDFVTLLDDEPYLINSMTGLGGTGVISQVTKAPFQDGSTLLDKILEERVITVVFTILASTAEDLYERRREISKIFNPKLGQGLIRFLYPGGVKVITATVEGAPTFSMNNTDSGKEHQRVAVSLLCTSPFWEDENDITHGLIAFDGAFSFPLEFNPTISMGTQGSFVEIDNIGDVKTPVGLVVHGEIVNPSIINITTGEYITLNTTINDGDKVEIDTSFGNKRIELVEASGTRTNIFHLIDIDSTFWSLVTGVNRLEYSADSAGTGAAVYITHNRRYLGI